MLGYVWPTLLWPILPSIAFARPLFTHFYGGFSISMKNRVNYSYIINYGLLIIKITNFHKIKVGKNWGLISKSFLIHKCKFHCFNKLVLIISLGIPTVTVFKNSRSTFVTNRSFWLVKLATIATASSQSFVGRPTEFVYATWYVTFQWHLVYSW